MVDDIPVIDIAALDSPATRAAIDRACSDWGFFQIVGHGIDEALTKRLLAVSREFFAQPLATKHRLLRDAENPWGYFDQELTKNRRDWKEIYDFGPGDGDRLAPRWPEGPLRARFEPTLRAYYDACTTLARRLLEVIVSNLGPSREEVRHSLTGFDRSHTSFIRLNHCPVHAEATTAADTFGVGEHTDAGALTLLLQDGQPGLEVRRGSEWHLVPPLHGALVVNIGDIVQVWSNDRYVAALHRVFTNPAKDRCSVPFFLNPSYETVYAPLMATVTPRSPARYAPIGWREFRALRAAGDYTDLGEEIQIEHYRSKER